MTLQEVVVFEYLRRMWVEVVSAMMVAGWVVVVVRLRVLEPYLRMVLVIILMMKG